MSALCSFFELSDVPLWKDHISLSIHRSLVDGHLDDFYFVGPFVYKFLGGHEFLFFLGIYLGVKLLHLGIFTKTNTLVAAHI